MKMKVVTLCLIISLSAGCVQAPVFTVSDRADLGAYLAYKIVVTDSPSVPEVPDVKPGDVCPECGGRGKQGDGTIEYECNACNGTGRVPKLKSDDAVTNNPEGTNNSDNANVDADKSTNKQHDITSHKKPVYRMSSVKWTVNKKNKYSTEELATHLSQEHQIETDGYSREEMQTMHDNIHNGFTPFGSPK